MREPVERRLAGILAADVAGYSRLMGADEEGTLNRLKAHHRELIDPKIKEHRGRIVKTTGDGMLAEFPSVVDGVRCAVEIQRGMVDRNADTPADKCIRFRNGINLGDVIIDGDDIYDESGYTAAGTARLRNRVRDRFATGRGWPPPFRSKSPSHSGLRARHQGACWPRSGLPKIGVVRERRNSHSLHQMLYSNM